MRFDVSKLFLTLLLGNGSTAEQRFVKKGVLETYWSLETNSKLNHTNYSKLWDILIFTPLLKLILPDKMAGNIEHHIQCVTVCS